MAANLYRPLDASIREMRILEIAPSTDATAPIKCKLHVVSLDSTILPQYVALSYVWGDPKFTTLIEVNSISCQITTNLESALRHIRKSDEIVTLWADAVCVNQDDLEERGSQVPMMGSIYSTAEEVIAWLGEEYEDSHLAFQLISQWAQWIRHRGTRMIEFTEVEENVQLAFDGKAIAAAESLGRRAYWTRIWALQELVLGKRIDCLCGRIRLPFSDFQLAGNAWITIKYKYCEDGLDPRSLQYLLLSGTPLKKLISAVSTFAPDSSLVASNHATTLELSLDLLLELQHVEATDPRDKIYGILGTSPSSTGYRPTPDYAKTTGDLFCEIAKEMLLASRNLKVAHCAARDDSDLSTLNLPSWVPEWGKCRSEFSLMNFIPWYRQSSSTLVSNYIRFSDGNRILCCKCVILDHVRETYQNTVPCIGDEGTKIFTEKILGGAPIGGRSALHGLFRAISLDTSMRSQQVRQMIPSSTEYYAHAALFLKSMARQISHRAEFEEELEALSHIMDQEFQTGSYGIHLLAVMSGRVPFRTTNSKMGVGPSPITPGDVICHLAGHEFPFILRYETDHYVVRGECYVSGIELPELTEDVLSKMQEFEIR